MNFSKFLLLDGSLILVGILFLLILQGGKEKFSFFGNLNSNKMQDQSSITIPQLKELLELELLARKEGSGIEFESLIGLWKFVSVWKKEVDENDFIASSLLRLFSASLELRKDELNKEFLRFDITNFIQFGTLVISFIGSGELKGSQPLLPFFFERIELKLGNTVLINRILDVPALKNRPFFALIGMEENGKWLAARGRGGGLALWLKD